MLDQEDEGRKAPVPASTVGLEPITLEESRRLNELEKVIAAGRRAFLEVGDSLAEIRANRLYRSDFSTFEEYCATKLGFKRAHAHRLIKAAGLAHQMSPMGDISSERVARELGKVPKTERKVVMTAAMMKAQSAKRKMTATDISEAASQMHSKIVVAEPEGQAPLMVGPKAKTQRSMERWYWKTTPKNRGKFLNSILSFPIQTEDMAEFKQRVVRFLEIHVTEVRPKLLTPPTSLSINN